LSRISIFGFRIFAELTLEIMPSGLRPKPGPLDPDLYRLQIKDRPFGTCPWNYEG
jgi:hypothetical protein